MHWGSWGGIPGGYALSEVCLCVAGVGAAGIVEGAVVVRLAAEVSWCIMMALVVVLYAGSSSVLCCAVKWEWWMVCVVLVGGKGCDLSLVQ